MNVESKSAPKWRCAMYSAAKRHAETDPHDVKGLYIKLERMASVFLNSKEMEEGDSFKFPLENGSFIKLSFYEGYTTAVAEYPNGKREPAVTKESSYRMEYAYLEATSSLLESLGLAIGPKCPPDFAVQLRDVTPGEIIVFNNGKSYVCSSNNGADLRLTETSPFKKGQPRDVLDPSKSETLCVDTLNPSSVQRLYSKVRSTFSSSVNYRLTTLTQARASLNRLLVQRGESKEFFIGPKRFVVTRGTNGETHYFNSRGAEVSESDLAFLVGWMEISPVTLDIKSIDADFDDVVLASNDAFVLGLERLVSVGDFSSVFKSLVSRTKIFSGDMKLTVSTFFPTQDKSDYEKTAYEFHASAGEVSVEKVSPEGRSKATLCDFMNDAASKYDEAYRYAKSQVVEDILKIRPYWDGENMKTYVDSLAENRVANDRLFSINVEHSLEERDF